MMLTGAPLTLAGATIPELKAQLERLVDAGAASLMILAGEAEPLDLAAWGAMLQALPVPVFGGIFPRLLHNGCQQADGVLVAGFTCPAEVCVIEGVDETSDGFRSLAGMLEDLRQAGTVMLWIDGMVQQSSALLGALYDHLGNGPVFFGGGAGTSRMESCPCVFTNRGVLAGAAQIVGLPQPFGVGVRHGWRPVAGPFLVSGVADNVITGLDFRPVMEVYQATVRRLSGLPVTAGNFAAVGRAFPLGLERMDGSFVLRDPVRVEGEGLRCIGEIAPQSALHILHGRPAAVLQAAAEACREALTRCPRPRAAFVVDCLNRAMYLDRSHARQHTMLEGELARPGGSDSRIDIFGVLSLGEIASHGGDSLEFHSKTFVVGLIPDERNH